LRKANLAFQALMVMGFSSNVTTLFVT